MADIGSEKTDKLIGKIEKKLDKIYDQASKEIGEKLSAYFEAHMKQYDKMWSKYENGEITHEQWEHWANGGTTGKQFSQLLESLSLDAVYANQIAMSIVSGYTPEAYAINHNYGMYQLDAGGVNIASIFTLYDRHTVERLVRGKKILLPRPRVDIPKDKQWNRQHIRNAITQGVLQGESIPELAKRLQGVVEMDKNSALRNARTAMTGAQNLGRTDSYREAKKIGVKVMNEWLATHDGRTRQSHLQIEGERVEIDEEFSNGCEYPGDPDGPPEEVYNCRCTLIPYLEEYDFKEEEIGEAGFAEFEEENVEDEYSALKQAIENARGYSPEEHEEINFSYNFWESLSSEERDAVVSYTGSAYEDMNNFLRGRDRYVSDYIKEYVKGCESALERAAIAEDTILYRGMGSENTLARALGISVEDIERIISNGSIVGMEFVEKGFCSTGVISSAGWDKEIILEIVAPKGTKGMYVAPISRFKHEKELLLQRGAKFEILGAEELNNEYSEAKYKLRVVVTGFEK